MELHFQKNNDPEALALWQSWTRQPARASGTFVTAYRQDEPVAMLQYWPAGQPKACRHALLLLQADEDGAMKLLLYGETAMCIDGYDWALTDDMSRKELYQQAGYRESDDSQQLCKQLTYADYWDQVWARKKDSHQAVDTWCEPFSALLPKGGKVLDLGSGLGETAAWLARAGLTVIASDYSEESLAYLRAHYPEMTVCHLDLNDPLPFADEAFEVVSADLSLHYFSDEKTRQIMAEIRRILKPDGVLLARVNSVDDRLHGAGKGVELEPHYYYVNGYNKRFFDRQDVAKYFGMVGEVTMRENTFTGYGLLKRLFEVAVVKK